MILSEPVEYERFSSKDANDNSKLLTFHIAFFFLENFSMVGKKNMFSKLECWVQNLCILIEHAADTRNKFA